MKLQVYRTNASSYQDSQFLSKEQRVLEGIQGVKYIQSLKEMDEKIPFILISNTHTKPQEIAPNILENTVLMIHPNSGHDNIDTNFIKEMPFPIIQGNPIRANAVCEYTLSCLFHHFTKIPNHQHWSETRRWNRKLLRDQKVLILGHGHIGKILNKTLGPLCREVKVYDPFETQASNTIITEWSDAIFEDVSVLIVAASLNPTSHHMIDNNILKKLAQENIIVNPARGEIIKEVDLVQYLQKNPKSTCYLDVFEKEPFTPGHLNEVSNLNKTSHIAGVYDKLNNDIISFEYIVIKDFVNHFVNNHISTFNEEYQECLLKEEVISTNE